MLAILACLCLSCHRCLFFSSFSLCENSFEGREAKQLGSLSREGGAGEAVGRETQVLCRWLMSSVKGKVSLQGRCCMLPRQGKWTAIDRYPVPKGISCAREDLLWSKQCTVTPDPDEVQCTWPMCQKCAQSTPLSYANFLTVINWRGGVPLVVDEVVHQLWEYKDSISSSLVLVVGKLSWSSSSFKRMCPIPCLYEAASQILTVSILLLKRI